MPSLFTITSSLLSTIGTIALASPLANNDVSVNAPVIVPRDEWQIGASSLLCLYMTNEPDWLGEGINLCDVGGKCGNKLPDGLTANVSSAGPEPGVTCFLYSEQNCAGDRSAPLVNPGYADLSKIGFDKEAQSWQCWKWCGWMGPSSASSSIPTASASSVGALWVRLVSITTTIDGDAQTVSAAAGLQGVSSSGSAGTSTSRAAIFETSVTTIVVTHTYADGSTTVISSLLTIPVSVTSNEASDTAAAVSITTTEGQTLIPSTTAAPPGVSITTTLGAAGAETTASGVSISTTQGTPLPGLTISSEGVTMPAQSVSAPSSASPKANSSGWTSLVTLTGVDATLTVTASG